MVWNPLSWRYWPSQGCCNNLYGQIYTAFSWSDYFICRKMCSIFGYQLHYVVPNYCQRLGNAPSKRCKLHIRNVNVQIIDPRESFGIVEGIYDDVPDRNVTFAVWHMCVWYYRHHFLLDYIVVIGGVCFVCWYWDIRSYNICQWRLGYPHIF